MVEVVSKCKTIVPTFDLGPIPMTRYFPQFFVAICLWSVSPNSQYAHRNSMFLSESRNRAAKLWGSRQLVLKKKKRFSGFLIIVRKSTYKCVSCFLSSVRYTSAPPSCYFQTEAVHFLNGFVFDHQCTWYVWVDSSELYFHYVLPLIRFVRHTFLVSLAIQSNHYLFGPWAQNRQQRRYYPDVWIAFIEYLLSPAITLSQNPNSGRGGTKGERKNFVETKFRQI